MLHLTLTIIMKPVARDILLDNRGQHSQNHHVFELVPGQPYHGSVCLLVSCLANLICLHNNHAVNV